MNKKKALACGLAAAVVALSGCTPAIYTVGGTIPSTNASKGATKAQFSLSGDSCDSNFEPVGTFTFHDKSAVAYNPKGKGIGLQMTGPVIIVSDCSDPASQEEADFCAGVWEGSPDPTLTYLLESCPLLGGASSAPVKFFVALYTSTNSRYPGDGLVWGCVQDNGQGHNAAFKDQAILIVPEGPYNGYSNSGSVQGNVATYACPELPPT